MSLFKSLKQSIRWRLGMPVASAKLEEGTDESVSDFYNQRITGCEFLEDESHYEHPRARWVLAKLNGGRLLEIGCGNGGMTRLISPQVEHITAFDVSTPSLAELERLNLPNVITEQGLVENFTPKKTFDWVVMSEVIEHLRDPQATVNKTFEFVSPGGAMLITTPNGHWESDEHLHEFSLESFSTVLAKTNCENFEASYLRDRDNRRRWLTGILRKANAPHEPDDFFDRKAIAGKRRHLTKNR